MADHDKQLPENSVPALKRRRASSSPSVVAKTVASPISTEHAEAMTWYRIDLHIHTPASTDYQQPEVSFLDILHKAEDRELDVIAFTDHNSVRGYADLWREIEDLELLESLTRLSAVERERLAEYRRLLNKILLLPGFEFTATFGFHILAIFPERTTVRMMEHVLLMLGVPEARLGSGEVGATTDVLRAYRVLSDGGALVIGAHVNSTHGIAMLGLNFGGQTKIAYTQDPYLHALEVTDQHLGNSPRSTSRFFNGSKAEYPRRMHCIQGSDAHRLDRDLSRESVFGVGERPTEVLLPERSFIALKELFLSTEFDRTRPFFPITSPADELRVGRTQGNSATQSFHEHVSTKRSGSRPILMDITAFANTVGGTVFIGASIQQRRPLAGVKTPAVDVESLRQDLRSHVTPSLEPAIDIIESGGKSILAIRVPEGDNKPYAIDSGLIYIRRDGKSEIASRDEIVQMVRASEERANTPPRRPSQKTESRQRRVAQEFTSRELPPATAQTAEPASAEPPVEMPVAPDEYKVAPGSGVEIVSVDGTPEEMRLTIRDLRHRRLISNVNPEETRGLWRDAIEAWQSHLPETDDFRWRGNFGVLKKRTANEENGRLTLAWRSNGTLRVFYAVNEDGLRGPWKSLVSSMRRTATKGSTQEAPNE